MMDSRWLHIERLFFEAATRDETERVTFLDEACGADHELRREVESLLLTDATGGDQIGALIEDTIKGAAGALFGDRAESMEGLRLGTWVIIREIGRGGMGAVYLAARADEQFKKQVAIKLVKRGIDTDAVLQRFLQERQILAGLEHPNIAGLLDGGTSPDGRPYFVMEYVEGIPIQAFCEKGNLTIRERCALFRTVCEPISYAHRNLVIHRDLKPANILVTANGSPKLLDFGIARLLSQEAGDHTIGLAGDSLRPFTPDYASPEQLRGEAVNTSTDIYSLGAVFFQILTGKRPQRTMPGTEAREFARPSTCVESKTLARGLAGDLDNIVLKATHPEAGRRYQSVDQLSEDIRRYLAGMTVLAREDKWTYSTGKFIRRHRLPVLTGLLMALILTAGIASVLWQARQTRFQRQRAEERLDELVELANQTVLNVPTSMGRVAGATASRREIVQSTVTYLDRLNAETGNDRRILTAMASAYVRLARIEGNPQESNLGNYKGAEQSFRKARKILEDLLQAYPQDINLHLAMANCSEGFGELLDATARPEEMRAEADRGLKSSDFVLAHDPRNLPARKIGALLHVMRVTSRAHQQNLAPVRDEMLEQLPSDEKLAADCPLDADCMLPLADAYSLLGTVVSRAGELPAAIAWYRKSVAVRERLFEMHPADALVQRDLMLGYGHLGDTSGSPFLMNIGDQQGALDYYRKAAKIADMMSTSDPTDRRARQDLGIVLGRIGITLEDPAEATESLAMLGRAMSTLEPLLASTPDDVSTATQLSIIHEYQGRRRKSVRDYHGALESYGRSAGFCAAVVKNHPDNRSCYRQLAVASGEMGILYALLGDRENALREAVKGAAESRALVSSDNKVSEISLWHGLERGGDVYRELASGAGGTPSQRAADWAQASAYYRKAVAEWKTLSPELRRPYEKEIPALNRKLAVSESELLKLH